jgi:hypothetical protein
MVRIFLTMALCLSCPAWAMEESEGWDDSKLHPTEKILMPKNEEGGVAGGAFGYQQHATTNFQTEFFGQLDHLTDEALEKGETPRILFLGAGHGAEPLKWLESDEKKMSNLGIVLIVNDLYEKNLHDLKNFALHHNLSQIKTVGGNASELGKNEKFLALVDGNPRRKFTAIIASNLFHYMPPQQTIDTLIFSRDWLIPETGKIFMCQGNINSLGYDEDTFVPVNSKGAIPPNFEQTLWARVRMRHLHFLNDNHFYIISDDISKHNDIMDKPVKILAPFYVATHDKWKQILKISGYEIVFESTSDDFGSPPDAMTNIIARPAATFDPVSKEVKGLKLRVEKYDLLEDNAYGPQKWQLGRFAGVVHLVLGFIDDQGRHFDEKEYQRTQKRIDWNSKNF